MDMFNTIMVGMSVLLALISLSMFIYGAFLSPAAKTLQFFLLALTSFIFALLIMAAASLVDTKSTVTGDSSGRGGEAAARNVP